MDERNALNSLEIFHSSVYELHMRCDNRNQGRRSRVIKGSVVLRVEKLGRRNELMRYFEEGKGGFSNWVKG